MLIFANTAMCFVQFWPSAILFFQYVKKITLTVKYAYIGQYRNAKILFGFSLGTPIVMYV